MKRRFTILTAALALLVCLAIPMGMWGQETVTATSTSMTASVSYQDLETGKLIEYKNSASNSYSNPLRIYSGNTFTIHAKEGVEKITQIAIVANSTSYANATGSATWTAIGEGSCSATASVSGSNVTVAITGTATTVTCKPSAQIRWNQLSVTYVTTGTPPAITYTMTYNANGGTGTMTDDNSPYDANATVTVLDNEFTRDHFDFVKWNTKADGTGTDYDEGDTFTISDNTTLYAQWESDGTGGEGSICFSNQSSCIAINSQSVTGEDNLGNTWTITTTGTSSFTANSGYYQVGSGSSPATSITFTTTLDEEVNVTDFSAMFGGFSATRASVVLKVDNTQVGSGTLNGTADVTVSSSSAQIGTTLTVIVTPTAGGVKCYNISYTYETITPSQAVNTTTTIDVPANFNTDIYQGTTAGTLSATVSAEGTPISGAIVTWSSSNTGVATIDANGAVTLVAVGTTTITANYAGVEDEYRPSTGTYELTVTSSEPIPGTQAMPYTVAQARAAIDAGTGTQGVYATGIVTEIVDAYSQQYHNVTFNFIDEGVTSVFLQAYRCVSGTGVDASTVAVGDVVVVYGNLTKYGSTYEFGQGCQLVSLTHPDILAPTFSVTAGGYAEAQSVELSCETENALIYYTVNGDNPTNASTPYNGAISVSETTTIKAVAYVGSGHSPVAEAAYYILSDDNVYTVTEALEFGNYPANNVFVHGIVSTAAESLSSGTLTYYISVDGNNSDELEVYKGKGLNNVAFTSVDDIQEGDIVTIFGNVIVYGNDQVIEFTSGNYLVSFERPAQQYTLTVTCSENVEIFTFVGESTDPGVEGSTTLQVTSGTEVGLSVSASEGYVLTLMVDGENVTSDLDDTGYYTFSMPAHDVVVFATAVEDVPPTTGDYVRITSLEQLTNGCKVVVASRYNTTATNYFAMKNTIGQKIQGTEFESQTSGNNEILASAIADDIDSYYWTVSIIGNEYTFTNPSGDKVGYGSNTNFTTNGDNTAWSIARGTSPQALVEYYKGFTITNVKTDTRGIALRDSDGNKAFGAYATSNANGNTYNFYLDFFVQGAETPAPETHTKSIAGWDVGEEENAFNFYLIASPIGDVDPTSVTITSEDPDVPTGVTNMVSGDFDLYYFDHNRDKEWVNYKQPVEGETSGFNPGFNVLETGKGYLYANKYDVTLVFTGTGITSGEQTIPLDYHAEGDGFTIDLPGWNLVGNPFAVNAWLVDNPGFYTMDPDGYYQAVTDANGVINAMEGVFVVATEEGQSVTFTTTEPDSKGAMLALNLSNGRKVIDRAIVRFDGGRQLPKLQFRQGSTKVYIPVEGQDYAIVSGEEMGELPVSFKAEENGSYNLSLSSEEVSFAYLHLIDNMTGVDVDLLQTPSYNFEARTTDYANRFKLVFATGDNSNDDNFAFFSNGSFVINNEGNAELQVIDVTGRIVKSESINGCTNVNVNAASGVYMLRLINGDNVKVQKVVVK